MEFWWPKEMGRVIIVTHWFGNAALCISTQDSRGIVTPLLVTRESLERTHTIKDEHPWYFDNHIEDWALEACE